MDWSSGPIESFTFFRHALSGLQSELLTAYLLGFVDVSLKLCFDQVDMLDLLSLLGITSFITRLRSVGFGHFLSLV